VAFGKPGRPPEDRLLRQREIYEAVAPVILERGARALSMRDAAWAACLSIGGLYHYFPTKRHLVLHGLDEAARTRLCRDNRAAIAHLDAAGLGAHVEAYLDHAERMFRFLQPAVLSALELGHPTFQDSLDAGLSMQVAELATTLRGLRPDLSDEDLAALGRAVRRVTLGSLIDRHATPAELRAQVRVLLDAYVPSRRSALPTG
jgi:AcrR family transcriptional regulator